jgi:hypothetical protein
MASAVAVRRARARIAGQTAAEILAHYYAGTTIGSIALDTPIRVLVLDNFAPTATTALTVYGRGGPWTVTGVPAELPAEARLRLFPPTTAVPGWRLIVDTAAGQVLYDGHGARFQVAGTSAAAITLLEADDERPVPGNAAADRVGHDGRRDQRASARVLPSRRDPGRDAVILAARGAGRPDDRGPLLRRLCPPPRDRHLRRL